MSWVTYYNVYTVTWQKVINHKSVNEYKTSIHNSKEEAKQAILDYGHSLSFPFPKEYFIPNYPKFQVGIELLTENIMQL
jgi:hypothetical protein